MREERLNYSTSSEYKVWVFARDACCFHLVSGTCNILYGQRHGQHSTARHGTDGQGRNSGQHILSSWYRKHLAYKYEPMYSHSHVRNIIVHRLTSDNNRSIIFLCTKKIADQGTTFSASP